MNNQLSRDEMWIESPLGKRLPDSSGSPVGVARLDPAKILTVSFEGGKEIWGEV